VVGLDLAHPLDRELVDNIRLDMVLVTEQDQIASIAALVVCHLRVEALTAWQSSLDMTDEVYRNLVEL